MILADVSGEILKRITPLKQGVMQYAWRGTRYNYEFQSISRKRISNSLLKVDTKHLLERTELQLMMKDIVMLIMHGGASLNVDLPNELQERCVLGGVTGKPRSHRAFC
jgi:tRNA A37 threonylcarbamoyltransferase TsaD